MYQYFDTKRAQLNRHFMCPVNVGPPLKFRLKSALKIFSGQNFVFLSIRLWQAKKGREFLPALFIVLTYNLKLFYAASANLRAALCSLSTSPLSTTPTALPKASMICFTTCVMSNVVTPRMFASGSPATLK